MENLEELREKINEIDKKMTELFVQRMKVVESIAKVKKEMGLPIYDQGREAFLLIRNGAYIEEKAIRNLYFDFLTKIFELSKKHQEEIN